MLSPRPCARWLKKSLVMLRASLLYSRASSVRSLRRMENRATATQVHMPKAPEPAPQRLHEAGASQAGRKGRSRNLWPSGRLATACIQRSSRLRADRLPGCWCLLMLQPSLLWLLGRVREQVTELDQRCDIQQPDRQNAMEIEPEQELGDQGREQQGGHGRSRGGGFVYGQQNRSDHGGDHQAGAGRQIAKGFRVPDQEDVGRAGVDDEECQQ